jgi:hypothetical protein
MATAPLTLRAEPTAAAPVVATLAKGAALLAQRQVVNKFVPVSTYGLTSADESGQYELFLYVEESAFSAGTRAD